jgi:putative insertion element HTH domain-containing protein
MADALTPKQHRAADLLGRNWTVERVAAEVEVSAKTVQRWKGREDFAALVKERRDALLSNLPNATATLEAALSATKGDGSPDWSIRVKAAQLLMTTADPVPPDPGGDDRPTFIFVAPDGEDGSDADADAG